MSRWRKFKQLSWSERGFLLYAAGGLAMIGLMLLVAGFERTVARLRRSSQPDSVEEEEGDRETTALIDWARRQAHLVAIAARFGPYRATCLPRSLFLWWFTRKCGLATQLCIGVRRNQSSGTREPGPLLAHAWIEYGDEVLNDREEIIANYAAFDAASLPTRVSWS